MSAFSNKQRKRERNILRARSMIMGIKIRWKRAKGVLVIKGSIPDDVLQRFRAQWYAMINGVENAWSFPVYAVGTGEVVLKGKP